MKLAATFVSILPAASAFSSSRPAFAARLSLTSLAIGRDSNVDLGGNSWQPDSEKMGSTDTGDYYPEGYDRDAISFEEGMGGSQAMMGGDRGGPALPGMENLGADAVMMGGIEQAEDIPEGMEFIMSSVPDGQFEMTVAASSSGSDLELDIAPVCMTFEDYFAGFTADSHPSFSVSPAVGRMDRRGGEPTALTITCAPKGQAGSFEAGLVINLPEDNSKICYKIIANVF